MISGKNIFGEIIGKAIYAIFREMNEKEVKSAICYLDPLLRVKATRRTKWQKKELNVEILLSIGRPNFKERKFIKDCKNAGEPFPIKKVQLIYWPKKRNEK